VIGLSLNPVLKPAPSWPGTLKNAGVLTERSRLSDSASWEKRRTDEMNDAATAGGCGIATENRNGRGLARLIENSISALHAGDRSAPEQSRRSSSSDASAPPDVDPAVPFHAPRVDR